MYSKISRRTVLVSGSAFGLVASLSPLRAQDPIRVAAIHASPVENAWNSVLHKALLAAQDEGVFSYVYSEGVSSTDYPRAMRQYAEEGFSLIVGESYPIERQAREVAAEYPDTGFLFGSSAGPAEPNFGRFSSRTHEGAYLAGMLAGAMTQTGTIGTVAALPIPDINVVINAFEAGAKSVNPEVKHLVTFIGTFFDPPKAREAGLALIDAGADILYGERIGTADAAKERGIKAIGSMIDYTPRYPDTVFANAMMGWRPVLDAALADVRAGTPTGRDYSDYGMMVSGGSDLNYVKGVASPEAEAAMEARRAEIKAGTFVVPQDATEKKA